MLPYDMFFSHTCNLLHELVFTISQVSAMQILNTDILCVTWLNSGSNNSGSILDRLWSCGKCVAHNGLHVTEAHIAILLTLV